ncbi:peptidylprolyl isomerase [Pseudomonas capeferrum]|uniref:SurA N-terminal domain-containing protein n=1 Tax=Pseudomonas capeferrum TaxID=1495066 RepID=UPI0015E3711B|nr:SurA N-terminal domain-containing protein [Pseudomonas capeferrum]MBA1203275.1 peptidylprolyl isomerase [Pseudomonas capeferrum]
MPILLLCLMLGLVPLGWADDMPVARVNGVQISVLRLERYFAEYLQAQGRAVASIRSPSLYRHLREQALDELIDKELLWQEAQRRGVQVSDATLDAYLTQLEQVFGDPAVFERRLAEAGFDRAAFADYTRHEMAAQQVYTELTAIEPPTDAQVQAYYQANRERLVARTNQSDSALVEQERGLVLARTALVNRLRSEARQAVRQQLRETAQVQRGG